MIRSYLSTTLLVIPLDRAVNYRYREGNPTTQMPALGRLEPVAAATRLVAKRSRERLQDRRTMVEKTVRTERYGKSTGDGYGQRWIKSR